MAGETDAHARRAAAQRDARRGSRRTAARSPTSTTSPSSPDPDRSRDFASAWRRFRGSRWRRASASIAVPTLDAMASGWLDAHAARPARSSCRASTASAAKCSSRRSTRDGAAFDASRVADRGESRRARRRPPRDRRARPRGRVVTIVGDGAVRYRDVFAPRLPRRAHRRRACRYPRRGRGAAGRASRSTAPSAPHALRPIYVRRPDAETGARARARPRAAPRRRRRVHDRAAPTAPTISPRRSAAAPVVYQRVGRRGDPLGAREHRRRAAVRRARAPTATLVAYCACWMIFDELHINSLAVDVAWRRQGVARRCSRRVMRDAAAAGATRRDPRSAAVERGRARRCTKASASASRACGATTTRIRGKTRSMLWHRQLAGVGERLRPVDRRRTIW